MAYDTSDFYDIVERTVESTTNKSLGKGTSSLIDNGQDGRKIKVTRVVTAADGTVLHKDTFISIWPMLPKQLEIGHRRGHQTTQSRPRPRRSRPRPRRSRDYHHFGSDDDHNDRDDRGRLGPGAERTGRQWARVRALSEV